MLHILTPIYRFENLDKIYNSILLNDDITWHISKSNKRETLTNDFIKNDKRVKLYNVDCEDNEIYKKRNEIFKNINEGYFCLLDDDTLFHETMYEIYIKTKNDSKMTLAKSNIKNTTSNVKLTLKGIWIKDNSYGLYWSLSECEILKLTS